VVVVVERLLCDMPSHDSHKTILATTKILFRFFIVVVVVVVVSKVLRR
jgi:hypothetical protein